MHTQAWTKRDTHTTFVKYSEGYSRYAQKDDSRDDGRECKLETQGKSYLLRYNQLNY